ncbi:MAG TPA: DNA primase [Candidatus Saccharimonadales bacterium]|jgi:DNA primase
MDAVEEVKSRLSIEDVVGEYVQLKRAGRNWKGLSPFTSERTPSFVVSPEKQIWHDFSSGKGGDMFSFVMEMEGLDFRETLERLARKAGVDLEQFRGTHGGGNAKLKERLFETLELAAKFYQVQFSRSQTALEYVFNKRQFTKDTALAWQLGYSPNNGSALVDFLKSKRFSEAEIKGAGLSARAYRGGIQDMFRGRLMIPLADGQGRVIGFTARLLADEPDAPKYINTPQTILYDKSRHVYGLHLAKEAIRKSKFAVIAEGNLDVIMSHQAGVRQVVATAGTALTEQHLKALGRFTPDIRLGFDADKAGLAATERAIPIASKVGVSLSIITIPSGKDPDELIKQNPQTWQKIIQEPKYALDWLLARYEKLLDLNSAQGKKEFTGVLLPIVRNLSDSVEQDHYLNKIAELTQVSREALTTKLRQTETSQRPRLKSPKITPEKLDKNAVENIKAQNHLLAIALTNPSLREYLKMLTPDMLQNELARELLKFLQVQSDFSGKPDAFKVQKLVEYAKILTLQYEELYQGLELLELRNEAARLQARVVENFVKPEKRKLSAAQESADETTSRELLERSRQLDILLKQAKGGNDG